MGGQAFQLLVRRLRHLTGPAAGDGLSDGQLLERFVTSRDQAAFEVLVWRHGAMVLGLCRRMLRHEQDAEDAFQATFLALVRKAPGISKRHALASWLYKVAYRVALEARARVRPNAVPALDRLPAPAQDNGEGLVWRDLRPVLDEEVNRLPEKYRSAFVLCYLEGKTNEEAARQLGCPKGTVLSRLARARERLRGRLIRRGLGVAGGLLTAGLTDQALASLPARLIDATLKTAFQVVAGKTAAAVTSGSVAILTQGAIRAMFVTKLKLTTGVVLAAGMVCAGAALLGNWVLADDDRGRVAIAATSREGADEPPAAPKDKEAAEREDPVKAAQRRAKSQNNLKQIGLAMHNYHDVNGRFPPPAIYSKDGKPLLSWRVAILPYLDQDNLFKQFKLDEPWDSQHNKGVAAAIPGVYLPVGAMLKPANQTYYQVFVGKGAAFEVGKGFRLADFTDGTSNTILVVEAAKPVPWTKPEDLPFVPDQALPKLGGLFQGDFNALFADGSVHFVSRKADDEVLKAVITRAGGEVINFDKLHAPKSERGPRRQGDARQLNEENQRLRATLEYTKQDIAKIKEEMIELHAKPTLDKRLLEENAALREALHQATAELESLKEQKARLLKEIKNAPRGKPVLPSRR
jgi:RNA polymerase sigma factor (sigma-70 family)